MVMKYEVGEKIVFCPAHPSSMRGCVGHIRSLNNDETSAMVAFKDRLGGVDAVLVLHLGDLGDLELCQYCPYRLNQIVEKCPIIVPCLRGKNVE